MFTLIFVEAIVVKQNTVKLADNTVNLVEDTALKLHSVDVTLKYGKNIINRKSSEVYIQSSNGDDITFIVKGIVVLKALRNKPTIANDWIVIEAERYWICNTEFIFAFDF